jgi:hypothetical protein
MEGWHCADACLSWTAFMGEQRRREEHPGQSPLQSGLESVWVIHFDGVEEVDVKKSLALERDV